MLYKDEFSSNFIDYDIKKSSSSNPTCAPISVPTKQILTKRCSNSDTFEAVWSTNAPQTREEVSTDESESENTQYSHLIYPINLPALKNYDSKPVAKVPVAKAPTAKASTAKKSILRHAVRKYSWSTEGCAPERCIKTNTDPNTCPSKPDFQKLDSRTSHNKFNYDEQAPFEQSSNPSSSLNDHYKRPTSKNCRRKSTSAITSHQITSLEDNYYKEALKRHNPKPIVKLSNCNAESMRQNLNSRYEKEISPDYNSILTTENYDCESADYNLNSTNLSPTVQDYDSRPATKPRGPKFSYEDEINNLRIENAELDKMLTHLRSQIQAEIKRDTLHKEKLRKFYTNQVQNRFNQLQSAFYNDLNDFKNETSEHIQELNQKIEATRASIKAHNQKLEKVQELYNTQHERYKKVEEERAHVEGERDAALKTINQFSRQNTVISSKLQSVKLETSQSNSLLQSLHYQYKQVKVDILSVKKIDENQQQARRDLFQKLSSEGKCCMDLQAKLKASEDYYNNLKQELQSMENNMERCEKDLEKEKRVTEALLDAKKAYIIQIEKLYDKIKTANIQTQTISSSCNSVNNENLRLQKTIEEQSEILKKYQEYIIKQPFEGSNYCNKI